MYVCIYVYVYMYIYIYIYIYINVSARRQEHPLEHAGLHALPGQGPCYLCYLLFVLLDVLLSDLLYKLFSI